MLAELRNLLNTQFGNFGQMAGSESSGAYVVIAATSKGRVGVRHLRGCDHVGRSGLLCSLCPAAKNVAVRIRVEPAEGATLAGLDPAMGWKQPGQDGQQRYSISVAGDDIEAALIAALLALDVNDGGPVLVPVGNIPDHYLDVLRAVRATEKPLSEILPSVLAEAFGEDVWTKMAGTERTYEYVLVAGTEKGRVGVRQIGENEYRVRVEPVEGVKLTGLTKSKGWKQPGDDDQQRHSIVVEGSEALKKVLVLALKAIGADNPDERVVNENTTEAGSAAIDEVTPKLAPPAKMTFVEMKVALEERADLKRSEAEELRAAAKALSDQADALTTEAADALGGIRSLELWNNMAEETLGVTLA